MRDLEKTKDNEIAKIKNRLKEVEEENNEMTLFKQEKSSLEQEKIDLQAKL